MPPSRRYDTENLAAVHGHDDVFWDAAEMDEVVELPKGGVPLFLLD